MILNKKRLPAGANKRLMFKLDLSRVFDTLLNAVWNESTPHYKHPRLKIKEKYPK